MVEAVAQEAALEAVADLEEDQKVPEVAEGLLVEASEAEEAAVDSLEREEVQAVLVEQEEDEDKRLDSVNSPKNITTLRHNINY